MPFVLGAGACVVMCVYSLMALPHTPPRASGQKATVRSVLGLDALAMLKDPTYLVFVIASVLACIPLTFYYSFTNAYLNEVGVVNAAGKMTLGPGIRDWHDAARCRWSFASRPFAGFCSSV